MADFPSRGVRIRRERVAAAAWISWALLSAFIVYGSHGTWSPYQPGIWAPTLVSVRDVVVNVLLYVAFGALGAVAMRGSYRRHWLRLTLRLVVVALLFSGVNEALQLYTIDRVASVTDIVSAAIGSAIGAALFSAGGRPR